MRLIFLIHKKKSISNASAAASLQQVPQPKAYTFPLQPTNPATGDSDFPSQLHGQAHPLSVAESSVTQNSSSPSNSSVCQDTKLSLTCPLAFSLQPFIFGAGTEALHFASQLSAVSDCWTPNIHLLLPQTASAETR